jgi:hypothetical protein
MMMSAPGPAATPAAGATAPAAAPAQGGTMIGMTQALVPGAAAYYI